MPEPAGPMIETKSPALIERSTSSTSVTGHRAGQDPGDVAGLQDRSAHAAPRMTSTGRKPAALRAGKYAGERGGDDRRRGRNRVVHPARVEHETLQLHDALNVEFYAREQLCQRGPERPAEQAAYDADGHAFEQEDGSDVAFLEAHRFQDRDVAGLLVDHRGDYVEDAEAGDHQNRPGRRIHDSVLDHEDAEHAFVCFLPGLGAVAVAPLDFSGRSRAPNRGSGCGCGSGSPHWSASGGSATSSAACRRNCCRA